MLPVRLYATVICYDSRNSKITVATFHYNKGGNVRYHSLWLVFSVSVSGEHGCRLLYYTPDLTVLLLLQFLVPYISALGLKAKA